ncbi:MAG TPA: TerC family protein [Longimicrobiales bacterium]
MATSIWFWVGFNALVLVLLALDLGVFHRRAHEVRLREAAIWSTVWVTLAIAIGIVIYVVAGGTVALQYLTGYLIEKSLSVDNLFVFITIFTYFGVPARLQHRVLYWGIIGALLMRGVFIAMGVYLIEMFDWVMYVFGVLLLVTGARMAVREEKPFDAETNRVVRLARRLLPIEPQYHGQKFFVRMDGRILVTPLFLTLLLVEISDILFAVDSIPAIFAVTRDPFIVYTANVMAILGLRAMYFLLAGVMPRFHKLRFGLAGILMFVGIKMLLEDVYHVPVAVSLGVIALALAGTVVWSLTTPPPEDSELPHPGPAVLDQGHAAALHRPGTGAQDGDPRVVLHPGRNEPDAGRGAAGTDRDRENPAVRGSGAGGVQRP